MPPDPQNIQIVPNWAPPTFFDYWPHGRGGSPYFYASIALCQSKTLVPWTIIQPEGDHTFEELLSKIKVIILAKIV